MMGATRRRVAQAWIALNTEDPEAVSAFTVIRHCLEAGGGLEEVRRFRLVELTGPLPGREMVEDLLHRSTQFYNPHKERCILRWADSDPVPAVAEEKLVLVFEREGLRRASAERWWRHETGEDLEVREGVVWGLRFAPGPDRTPQAEDLAVVRDPAHGLLCNPNSQEHRVAGPEVPVPWLGEGERR